MKCEAAAQFSCGSVRSDFGRPVSELTRGSESGLRVWPLPGRAKAKAAFTLVEVLAALLFMALVIPVAVDGLRVASRASVVGQRKAVAARIAQRVINEQAVAGQTTGAALSGVTRENNVEYAWIVKLDVWNQAAVQNALFQLQPMQLVTVQVNYPVQGQMYNLQLCTLLNTPTSQ